jgi:hypothetical protein
LGSKAMGMGSGEGFIMRSFLVCTIVRVLKSRKLRYSGLLARMEEGRIAF